MNIIDYVEFTQKPTEHGLVYEHATVPTFTLAYYFEVLLNPRHPEHPAVLRFAGQIQQRAREEKLAIGRKHLQEARANMTDAEWTMIVD